MCIKLCVSVYKFQVESFMLAGFCCSVFSVLVFIHGCANLSKSVAQKKNIWTTMRERGREGEKERERERERGGGGCTLWQAMVIPSSRSTNQSNWNDLDWGTQGVCQGISSQFSIFHFFFFVHAHNLFFCLCFLWIWNGFRISQGVGKCAVTIEFLKSWLVYTIIGFISTALLCLPLSEG